ncbi:DUF4402 domain-containing protein [Chitinophaga sp. HK235]|uniref:DUF4402 domain-containing protein n=1 Tax=Chitinophaga sp. HK235 TaxID=2952571 RepID=UPI001BACA1EE|nr:DUF4402 domain-containing protein [Chitinophaga sp. HK235]
MGTQSIQQARWWAVTGILFLLSWQPVKAQIRPTIIQQLNFGTFSTGQSGGTITISPTGACSATGDVISINKGGIATPAVIELEAPIGSRIAILETNSLLKGSHGSTMTLRIKGSEPAMPFVTKTPRTSITIGGTLTVNRPGHMSSGKYDGQIFITFLAGE